MRSVYINGKEDRKSLGVRDKQVAMQRGYELLRSLLANDRAIEERSLTVGLLARLYLESPKHGSKKDRTQRHDERKLEEPVVAFLGKATRVEVLSASSVERYVMARRSGEASLIGVTPGRRVGNRTIQADLIVLRSAIRWAVGERTRTGQRLLREDPLAGVQFPREQNSKRPVMQHDEYLKLLEVANEVSPLLRLALIIAEGTGRRNSACRKLLWRDVRFDEGMIHWRAENDKKGYEQVVPMSQGVHDALLAQQALTGAGPDAPVFPGWKRPTEPRGRHSFDRWLRLAYERAELKPQPGGMWHPVRRKWVTERKGYPVADVAAAGGWRDEKTMLRSYQGTDPDTVRQIVLNPTHRLNSEARIR